MRITIFSFGREFDLVTSHVFVQIALLSEGQAASELIFEWTNKRSFFGVDSQMIIEVVPFSKV